MYYRTCSTGHVETIRCRFNNDEEYEIDGYRPQKLKDFIELLRQRHYDIHKVHELDVSFYYKYVFSCDEFISHLTDDPLIFQIDLIDW